MLKTTQFGFLKIANSIIFKKKKKKKKTKNKINKKYQ